PDLQLTHVEQEGKSLTLLGFALDPDDPEAGNGEILRRLIVSTERCEDIFQVVETLGGRWVLIVHDGEQTIVLHDATAQRQVYFTRPGTGGGMICASKPGVMAERLGFTMDASAVDFIQSRKLNDYEIYWMPGDTSLYAEIAALLPNHFLSLSDGSCHRFWPAQALPPMSYPQVLAECVRLLRGQIDSAQRRYPLAISMTAGWDSRLVLALHRQYTEGLYAFTLVYPHLPCESRDVCVPKRLLGKLGIEHHLVPYPDTIDGAFKEIFRRNNISANSAYCADTQSLYAIYPGDRVCVTGDVAEIVKCYYGRRRPKAEPVSALELAELGGLGKHPFALEAFGRWLEHSGGPPIDLLDLFCWEQMAGRWQARVRAEYDMAQESFAPLNNRRLLRVMLTVDAGMRCGPDFRLFGDLIEALWPDVLSEPINPPESVSRARRVLNILKKTGLPQMVPEGAKAKIKGVFRS
ncbi:MAG: hypothetical protein ABI600_11950, partial [Luteolibacter sp.]